MSSFSLVADTELLRTLGINLPPRVESLRRRSSGTAAAIAVVGLFSRGKSTLFNQLVGAPIAATGNLPTTKLMTEASTGQRFAAAYWGDRSRQLPLDPDRFAEAIAELGDPYPERAEITGPFRLPAGMRLVDTPGTGAISDLNERDWFLSGAGAALLVLALPPGPQGEDWDLLDGLDQVFPGANAIALKATSSDVDADDLQEVLVRAKANSSRPIVAVPLEAPAAGWGEDPAWEPVESVLEGLEAKARAGTADAAEALRSWLDERLATLTIDDLSEQGRSLAAVGSLLVPGASAAASRALDRIGEDLRSEHLRSSQLAAEHERQLAAQRADRLAPRRAIGSQLLTAANQWRSVPYETQRSRIGDLFVLIERIEAWTAGRTGDPLLADIERALDEALAATRDQHGSLSADELIERGERLARPQLLAPMEAHRMVTTWISDATCCLSVEPRGPQCQARRLRLDSLVSLTRT